MSIFWRFVQDIGCDFSKRIPEPKSADVWWRTSFAHLQKRKALRYLCVMTVIGSQVCDRITNFTKTLDMVVDDDKSDLDNL